MKSYDNQKDEAHSKMTSREALWGGLLILFMGIIFITLSIYDFSNDQFHTLGRHGSSGNRAEHPIYFWVANIISFSIGVLLLFATRFLFRYRNKNKPSISDQLKALNNVDNNGHIKISLNNNSNMQSDENEFPLIAKVALGLFFLLWIGVGIFAFSIYCKSISASRTQIISLVLIFNSITSALYFKWTLRLRGNRSLITSERIYAVIAFTSLCIGIYLWFFYN